MLSFTYGWFDQTERYAHGGYQWTSFSGTFCADFGILDLATYALAEADGDSSASADGTLIPFAPAPWHPLSATYQWFDVVEYYPHGGSTWTTWTGIFASNTPVLAAGVAFGAAAGYSLATGTASANSLVTGVLSGTSCATAAVSSTLPGGTTTGTSTAIAAATRRVLAIASTTGANIAAAQPITLVSGVLSGAATTTATALGLLRGFAAETGTSTATATPTAVQTVVGTAYNTSDATATGQEKITATGALSGASTATSTGAIGRLSFANGLTAGRSTTSATARPILKGAAAIAGTNDLAGAATAFWAGYARVENTCTVVAGTEVHYRAFAYTNGNSIAAIVAPASQQRGIARAGNGSTATATAIKTETARCSTAGRSASAGIANAIVVLLRGEADGASAVTADASAYVPGGAIEADGTSGATADTKCLFVACAWLVTDANAWAFPNALESACALSQNYSFATAMPAAVVKPATGEAGGHSSAIYSTPPVLATGVANGGSDCYGHLCSTMISPGRVWCKSVLTGTAEVWCPITANASGSSQLCGRGATKVVSGSAASSGYGMARVA